MARKICLVNYKGGVGKTSLVVNLASTLTFLGKKVLVVDLDPQSNSSIWLMRLDRWNRLNREPEHSIYASFVNSNINLKDILIKDAIKSTTNDKILAGLDLIPTTFNLMDLEHDTRYSEQNPCYLSFHEQLLQIEKDYDYIFFDCPPNAFRGTQCGLFSADEVYVPANPDSLSLIGFALLTDKMVAFNELNKSHREHYGLAPRLVSGLILNAIKQNVNIEVPKQRLQMRLDHFKIYNKAHADAKIFQSEIRDAIIMRRAVAMGLPVVLLEDLEGAAKIRDDYLHLANELESLYIEQPALT